MSSNKHTEPKLERKAPLEGPDISSIHAAILREKQEPLDGREPVPMVWLTAILALAMWAGAYLGKYNMDFDASVLEGASTATLASAPEPAAPIDPLVAGKRVYNNCMACHQATGQGIAGQFPPLAESEYVLGGKETLVRILLHGLEGTVSVRGHAYNGVMPAWDKLKDEQIANVLSYVRNTWGNQASHVEPEMVAAIRADTKSRSEPWSAAALVEAARADSGTNKEKSKATQMPAKTRGAGVP